MPTVAPIALFVYSRPDHTRRTLEALERDPLARESELFIFADGPKTFEHEAAVHAARSVVAEKWAFAKVTVIEREQNYGLARSITDGVSMLCRDHGRVIVVEDDIVVAPGFLNFMNKALDRFADEPRVMQISGYMFPSTTETRSDAFFLPLISCWGWATWARAWARYDPSASGMALLSNDPQMRRRFNLDGAYDYYGLLKHQIRGRADSWGVRWLLSVFMLNGLVLFPARSFVENSGFDGSGTHRSAPHAMSVATNRNMVDFASRVEYPTHFELDASALNAVKTRLAALRPNFLRRLAGKLIG